jgi:hypothetical protein
MSTDFFHALRQLRASAPKFLACREKIEMIGHGLDMCLLTECSGASLRHSGEEILRRVEDLEATAAKGSSARIPLLHPWANRLAGPRYRVLRQQVVLDVSSPLLHLDERGLPMHGVPWSFLPWVVTEAGQDFIRASLEWSTSELLAVFPFRHRVERAAILRPDSLTLETTLIADSAGPVLVSFRFHPYLGLWSFRARTGGWNYPQCGSLYSTGAGSRPVKRSLLVDSTRNSVKAVSTTALPS